MAIETQKYIRKPLYVDAVQITSSNFDAIAAWCQGEIQREDVPGKGTTKTFIKVRVQNPKNPRQTKAFVGDWILYTDTGYKVYTSKAFHASFDLVAAKPGPPPQPIPGQENIAMPPKTSAQAAEDARAEKARVQSAMTDMQERVGPDVVVVPATPENIAQAVHETELADFSQ